MVEGETYHFKKAKDIAFCNRSRFLSQHPELQIIYHIDQHSIEFSSTHLKFNLKSPLEPSAFLAFDLSFLEDSSFNIFISETNPLRPRFRLKPLKPKTSPAFSFTKTENFIQLETPSIQIQAFFTPFSLKILKNSQELLRINHDSLLNFERYRKKGEKMNHNPPVYVDATGLLPGINEWEESFKEFHEEVKHGPSSVGLDFNFIDCEAICGLPEHSDSVFLQDTTETDPYRLFNLDVYNYPLDSTASIYGAIPFVFSKTVGIYWANPSETFLDLKFEGNSLNKRAHWFSECGNIDFYVFVSDSPLEIVEKFTMFNGQPAFPPRFALGYHQCRWNYYSQEEVIELVRMFRKHLIPVDVIWLDIEYTEDKNYFTWDFQQFPQPIYLQDQLALNGIRLVCIIDPHFRNEPASALGKMFKANDILVKNKNHENFVGKCWSGQSVYVDYLNPKARKIWSDLYSFSSFQESTPNLHIWNDMNEASVFEECETTFPRSCQHFNSLEHREVHNIYGKMMQKATFKGLLSRSGCYFRPFLLSRSFFAGSHKYGAVWTGDNKATWGYLKASVSMCLSIASGGISLCGADIGGFSGEPSEELMKRWFQLGAFLPFFRSHSSHRTKHREPWCYDQETMRNIRNSIIVRYTLLPYWYTLFYLYRENAEPVIKSLFLKFPNAKKWAKIDEQYFVGDHLMVCPVMQQGVRVLNIELPQGRWFDYFTYEEIPCGLAEYQVNPANIPVFIYAGGIIPIQAPGLNTRSMENSPYTFVVALDFDHQARGKVFIDDGESFEYQSGKHVLGEISMAHNKIEYRATGNYNRPGFLTKLIILGLSDDHTGIKSSPILTPTKTEYKNRVLEITFLNHPLNLPWELHLA